MSHSRKEMGSILWKVLNERRQTLYISTPTQKTSQMPHVWEPLGCHSALLVALCHCEFLSCTWYNLCTEQSLQWVQRSQPPSPLEDHEWWHSEQALFPLLCWFRCQHDPAQAKRSTCNLRGRSSCTACSFHGQYSSYTWCVPHSASHAWSDYVDI